MIASFADAEQIAALELRLKEAHEALDAYAQEKKTDLETIRRLEARVRQDEAYENEVAKLLVDAGAPVAVMPIERVKWAARRLVEDRPISDKRVTLILQIIQNARDDFKDRESWFPMVAGRFKDIEAALSAGSVIGRDEGPYHAARKIADNGRADNIISTWFYAGSDGCWRVRQEVLVAAIVEAIEEQVAIATAKKTALLAEVASAFKVGGVDCGDLLARIDTILKGPTP
ncbi:hypothetical protein HOT99_gp239 [Caulobacter phage CcrBL10]|uniref:Uncharacterized protein n=1 Tax=Caulobacter phage CcrBL10 TaxID=2283269 RepID=A0A385ECB7_9CAUD|nr:hypothetical protein HOT99_gp239 [Caulobacter phage CcrBL10]AXQ68378.1 hypothetical protein CcrBL10_gp174c [Caulobacter phage CcrBL10]